MVPSLDCLFALAMVPVRLEAPSARTPSSWRWCALAGSSHLPGRAGRRGPRFSRHLAAGAVADGSEHTTCVNVKAEVIVGLPPPALTRTLCRLGAQQQGRSAVTAPQTHRLSRGSSVSASLRGRRWFIKSEWVTLWVDFCEHLGLNPNFFILFH